MPRTLFAIVIAVLALATTATTASAVPGDLDLGFGGGDGLTLERPINTSSGAATIGYRSSILSDGSVVLTGTVRQNVYVAKFLPTGALDTSFGTDGVFERDIASSSYDEPHSINVDGDGNIVVAGRGGSVGFVLRLTPTGQLDTTFSGDGITTLSDPSPSPGSMEFRSFAFQTDGKIVAVSHSIGDLLMARYLTNGQLDASFDGDGIVTGLGLPFSDEIDVQIDTMDRIHVGSSNSGSGYKLARFTSAGALDTAMYGTNGLTNFAGTSGTFVEMDMDTTGRVVIAGGTSTGTEVVRVDQNGLLDINFNTTGIAFFDPTLNHEGAGAIETVGSQVYIAGRQENFGGFIARFTDAGLQDATYQNGSAGYVQTTCAPGASTPICSINDLNTNIFGDLAYVAESSDTSFNSATDIGRVAPSGAYVSGFGSSGRRMFQLETPDSILAYDSAPATGGRTLVSGVAGPYNDESSVFAIYEPDGTLDTSFDGDGVAIRDFYPGTNDYLQGASVDVNGNVYAYGWLLGTTSNELFIGKFTSTGAIDTSFGGGDGLLEVDIDSDDEYPTGLIPLANGNLLFSGFVVNGGSDRSAFLVELQQSGTVEPTFNSGATAIVAYPGTTQLQVGKPLRDGAGNVMLPMSDDNDLAALRFEPDGDLDPTFDSDGIASYPSIGTIESSGGTPSAVAVGDDYVVAASTQGNPTGVDPFVAKIDQSGQLDASFGTAGVTKMSLSATGNESAPDLAQDAQGRFTISTVTNVGPSAPSRDFVSGRVLANGAPDPTYGSGILRVTPLPSGLVADSAVGLVSQSNRMLVFGGASDPATFLSFFSVHAMQIDNPVVPPTTPPVEPGPTGPSAACLAAKKKLASLQKLLKKQKRAAKKAKTAKKKKSTRKAIKKTNKRITAAKKLVKKECG